MLVNSVADACPLDIYESILFRWTKARERSQLEEAKHEQSNDKN